MEISDRNIIRKSDIALPKSNSFTIRSFTVSIFFSLLLNSDLKVVSKRNTIAKQPATRKNGPKTRIQTDKNSSSSDKKQTTNTGCLACEESMLTPWDTSDFSDSEWIAGGFPWRDMIRECIFFDTISQQELDTQFLDSHIVQNNIKA